MAGGSFAVPVDALTNPPPGEGMPESPCLELIRDKMSALEQSNGKYGVVGDEPAPRRKGCCLENQTDKRGT